MERRQKWLESQFRRHDECLSKMAKQLQVLQEFITLNFDSYRQYALDRESSADIFAYRSIDKRPVDSYFRSRGCIQGGQYQHGSPSDQSECPSSQTTLLPAPDSYQSRFSNASSQPTILNSESDFDEEDVMDPAPGESDVSSYGALHGNIFAAVDLSTSSMHNRQYHNDRNVHPPQEPNSTTIQTHGHINMDYFEHQGSQGMKQSNPPPDSALSSEGPKDLSTEKYSSDHGSSAEGRFPQKSILGEILTAHVQMKLKEELTDDEESEGNCHVPNLHSCTTSTGRSRDKAHNYQSHLNADTMTTSASDIRSFESEPMSSDPVADHILELPSRIVSGKVHSKSTSSRKECKESQFITGAPKVYSRTRVGGSKKRSRVRNESHIISTSSSNASTIAHGSPSALEQPATTTTTRGRKDASGGNNTSKQCRFCGKTFQWLHSVKTHERLHTGIKPYVCKICGARFTQNGNLKVHAKTCVEKHAESYRSRNVLICSVCTEMFQETDALMDHQKSHDRMQWTVKEKTCQLCGEVFQKRSFLLEHEKVHVQDRSFLSSLGIKAEEKGNEGEGVSVTSSPGITTAIAESSEFTFDRE